LHKGALLLNALAQNWQLNSGHLGLLGPKALQVEGTTRNAGDGGHALIRDMSGTAQRVVLGLDLLLGALGLFLGFVLDKIDLRLVNLGLGLSDLQLLLDLCKIRLLGEHIDDGLLLIAHQASSCGGEDHYLRADQEARPA